MTSREVPAFHFCNFDRQMNIRPLDRFALMGWSRMRVRASLVPLSGQVRTDGLDRPFAAIPADLDENSFTYNAIAQIIAATGISVHDGDPRLWVNFDSSMLC